MRSPLEQIEASIKGFIEGKTSIQDWSNDQPASIRALIMELDTCLQTWAQENEILSGQFVFYVSQDDHQRLSGEKELEQVFSKLILSLASEYGIAFSYSPSIRFVVRRSLLPGQVEIKSLQSEEPAGQTGSITAPKPAGSQLNENNEHSAMLVLSDETSIPLSRYVTNLGRKSNNHIVFDDMRVSRNHAQIRVINGEYILFDTGSSGGTFVNGERINQRRLRSGDVLSLAGVKLIFSQEDPSTAPTGREITSKLGPTHKAK